MNEPTDDRLHEWVRRSVRPYEAPDDPRPDWLRVRRDLRRQRWGRRGAVAGFGLLFSVLSWWGLTHKPEVPYSPKVQRADRATAEPKRPLISTSPSGADYGLVSAPSKTAISKRTSPNYQRETNRKTADFARPVGSFLPPLTLNRPLTQIATTLPTASRLLAIPQFGPDEWAIRQQVLTGAFGTDSTAYRALSRNANRWANAVVVCDITSSMYPYSTQLMVWFGQQAGRKAKRTSVQGVIFFTDCDSAGYETRPDGPPGRFFMAHSTDPAVMLPTLLQASRHTRLNQFPAENDLEALLFAQRQFPDAKNLILLADNGSPVKGMDKLALLTKPVRIILAGSHTDSTQAFGRDYGAIARQSGGSLHTLEDDLDPARPEQTPVLRVGDHYYRYVARRKVYRRTRFTHRPERLLGPIWW